MADEPGVNPSWTASAGNLPPSQTASSSANTLTSLSDQVSVSDRPTDLSGQLAGPPPMAANPPPVTKVVATESPSGPPGQSPLVIPQTRPVTPTAPVEPAVPAELTVTHTRPGQSFPWRIVLVVFLGMITIGAIFYGLWWFGIGFGAPRNPQAALTKMAAALAMHPAYHTEGRLELIFTAADQAAATPTRTSVRSEIVGWLATAAQAATSETPEMTKIPTFPATPDSYGVTFEFSTDQTSQTVGAMTAQIDLSGLGKLLPDTFPVTATLQARRIGDTYYVRLPLLSLLVGSESNKWLVFDAADLAKWSDDGQPTAFDYQQIITKLLNGRRIGFERIGTMKTAHYRAELSLAELIRVWHLPSSAFTPSQLLTVEWWMGVRDSLPYQLKVTGQFTIADHLTTLNLTTTFSRYDAITTITAPAPDQVTRDGIKGLLGADLTRVAVKARDAERKSDLAALKSALALYHADHGNYPTSNGAIVRTDQNGNALTVLVTQGYIQALPDDPLAENNWYGYISKDGTTFELWSILEDTSDPQGITRDNLFIYIVTP